MKSRRTILRTTFAAAVAAFALTSAASAQENVVRVGFQKYGKLVLLKSKGSLEPKLKALGFGVKWVEFPSGPPLLEAINVGALDFGNTGEAPRSSRRPPARRSAMSRTSRRPQRAKPFWCRRIAR